MEHVHKPDSSNTEHSAHNVTCPADIVIIRGQRVVYRALVLARTFMSGMLLTSVSRDVQLAVRFQMGFARQEERAQEPI